MSLVKIWLDKLLFLSSSGDEAIERPGEWIEEEEEQKKGPGTILLNIGHLLLLLYSKLLISQHISRQGPEITVYDVC